MLLAATGKHSASPGEAVPQLVVSRLVDTGEATPLVKQIAKLPDATTPVNNLKEALFQLDISLIVKRPKGYLI